MKKIIRKFFNAFGFDIVKTNHWYIKNSTKQATVQVGNFSMLMPFNNPLLHAYKRIPNLNVELANLTKTIVKKYPDLVLIDVGANVGDTVAVVKTTVDLPIIAIEGDATSFKYLEINNKQFKNVSIINKFLGAQNQTISVEIEKEGWNNTLIPQKNATNEILLETLDTILAAQTPISGKYKLLKIDTEGFDTIILRGCTKLLTHSKPILYFEYNGENMRKIGENGIQTVLNLKQFGYSDIFIFDYLSNLILNTTLENEQLLLQLDKYLQNEHTVLSFFDICIVHKEDADIAASILMS